MSRFSMRIDGPLKANGKLTAVCVSNCFAGTPETIEHIKYKS
jgi:hypothetical protein